MIDKENIQSPISALITLSFNYLQLIADLSFI